MNSESVTSAFSESQNPQQAAAELYQQLSSPGLGFVLFFCSAEYDLERLASELEAHFGDLPLAGCTTAGEITPQGYGQGCITAIGFNRKHFAVEAAVIETLEGFRLTDAQALVGQLMEGCRPRQVAPIKGNSFALTLLDGLSSEEENVLLALNAALGSIPHFGGSAGDDIHLAHTHVFVNGRFRTDAAVVMLFNTDCDFEVFSTHHMESQQEKLVVTAADSESRTVQEINAEPAAREYARAVGVPLEELDLETFALKPIGVRLGDDYYVRSIQRVNDDQSLTFYCAIENGIVLTVMKPGDMMPGLQQEMERIGQKIGKPQLVIGCDCFLRRLETEYRGRDREMSDFLRENRVIGFNTYGEHIEGMHVNQTFTAVAIGGSGHD
ncbi:nitric oxide-sensing protein NosP [Marinobacterium jannaschii]|uniref:nitric oxide-sensing protein NosP n=1 Tax=Marinobacterium jannaschii TaxID=64970 RepID=UPI000482C6D7|nr:nitric oxide-sensing protein NosP [Marinobacterium jannaschii]